MQREIKFRAWNVATKLMIDLKKITPLALKIEKDGLFIPFVDGLPLMQFTGLKDKNGVEIYEGDIVKWGHLETSKEMEIRIAIVEINPCIQFNCKNISYPHVFKYGNFAYSSDQLEIIGNIYESPELLTSNINDGNKSKIS